MVPVIYDILRQHCTRGASDAEHEAHQARYDAAVVSLLESRTLRRRDPVEIWAAAWDKPFFANAKANVVGPLIAAARATGLFEDPGWVASTEFLDAGMNPGPRLRQAIEDRRLRGQCKATPRLHRVQSLAKALDSLAGAVNAFADTSTRDAPALRLAQEGAIRIAEAIATGGTHVPKVDGFGFTTACHLLADLGLPLYKPDIWICRIVSLLPGVAAQMQRSWGLTTPPASLDWLESRMVGYNAGLAYRRIVQPVLNTLLDNARDFAPPGLDLAVGYRRLRLVDWTVVHFAISAEAEIFGLYARPADLLCEDHTIEAPAHLRAFAHLLHAAGASLEMESALANARRKAAKKGQSPRADQRARNELNRQLALDSERRAARTALSWARDAYAQAVSEDGWHFEPAYPIN